MSNALPNSTSYVVVGGGVHGLSTAWHLAMTLKQRGKGSGADVILLDKSHPGAGSTGVACGIVRNFYMTEPMHTLVKESVGVWTYDPILFGYQQVGFISCGDKSQIPDYEKMYQNHCAIEYPSDLYVGAEAKTFLKRLWPDFNPHSIEAVLHEKLGGYSGTARFVQGMVEMCTRYGVNIHSGVEVQNYQIANGRVTALETNKGTVKCDMVVLAVGPWMGKHWELLGKPDRLDVTYQDGSSIKGKDMWTYWRLEEGEVYYDRPYLTSDQKNPPVLHIELMDTPVPHPSNGREISGNVYVYWKYASERLNCPGLQGGAMPIKLGPKAILDPYGHANDNYQAGSEFADYLTACMGMFMDNLKGLRTNFKERRNGGIGAFTPDNLPILDWIKDNVFMIADSGHGYKLTGVGKLLAKQLVSGRPEEALKPFAFSRYEKGQAFGSGRTKVPWV